MRISDWSSDVCSSDLIDGQRVDAVAGRAVKQYIALPDLGERIAFLGQLERDRRLGALDALRDDRLADAQREIIGDQIGRDRRVGIDDDVGQSIAFAGFHIDYCADRPALAFLSPFARTPVAPRVYDRVIITLGRK